MRLLLAYASMALALLPASSLAQRNGVSQARPDPLTREEAERGRLRQAEMREEVQRLRERLMREEAGNFQAMWFEHRPQWRAVFAFTRNAEATLRRHSSNPLFVARQVRYSMAELDAARSDAEAQLRKLGVPLGSSDSDEVGNDVDIVTLLEQPQVDRLLASGRLRLHPAVNVTGPEALGSPAVTREAARFVRLFPQDPNRRLGGTRELSHGRIILRNGCLRFEGRGGDDAIVYFAAETGLKLDGAGKLAFYDRPTGRTLARVGEMLAMSGGAGRERILDPKAAGRINAACGPGRIAYGGWFESREAFENRLPRVR